MVLYIVCFDLAAPLEAQKHQLRYWLAYLNSILCTASKPIPRHHINSKWRVLIVGTRADAISPNSVSDVTEWKKLFPGLPIISNIYKVSALLDSESTKDLFAVITTECTNLLDMHSKEVPNAYRDLWTALQVVPDFIITQDDISKLHPRWAKWEEKNDQKPLQRALLYLHSIGEIVLFGEGKVCTKPSMISEAMANFISHEHGHDVLVATNINCVRQLMSADNNKYSLHGSFLSSLITF